MDLENAHWNPVMFNNPQTYLGRLDTDVNMSWIESRNAAPQELSGLVLLQLLEVGLDIILSANLTRLTCLTTCQVCC